MCLLYRFSELVYVQRRTWAIVTAIAIDLAFSAAWVTAIVLLLGKFGII